MALNVSLITSYVTSGVAIPPATEFHSHYREKVLRVFSSENYGGHVIGADFYSFMKRDAGFWWDYFGRKRIGDLSAIQLLAEINDREMEVLVQEMLTAVEIAGSKLVALTSFIPEVNLADDVKRADDAVQGLMKIALEIGRQAKAPPPVVQMVAGSSVGNIVEVNKNKDDGKSENDEKSSKRFEVRIADRSQAMSRILRRMSRCLKYIEVNYETRFASQLDDLRIAFELEPGPLFLLHDWESIIDFCELVENSECQLVKQKVGLNLDIAHWWLANISVAQVSSAPKILDRVFHSHVSGHSKRAHFGDISLKRLMPDEKEEFIDWLSLLIDHAESSVDYSGYVSVEYEAAKSSDLVVESVNELIQMLDTARIRVTTVG